MGQQTFPGANALAVLNSPPGLTSPGGDTPLTWTGGPVRYLIIQNNTTANCFVDFDATATAGSLLLAPGATFVVDAVVTTLHLFTAAAQNINGGAGTNIVIRAWR